MVKNLVVTLINKLKWTCLLCIRVTMNTLTILASKTKDYLVNKELQELRNENKMLKERIQELEKEPEEPTFKMKRGKISKDTLPKRPKQVLTHEQKEKKKIANKIWYEKNKEYLNEYRRELYRNSKK